MNRYNSRQSVALMFSVLILVFLSIIGISFFSTNVNEANLAKRYLGSLRSFWASEAAMAYAVDQLDACIDDENCTVSGNITYAADVYSYSATITHPQGLYYQIDSAGSGRGVTRETSAVIKKPEVSNKFEDAVETRGPVEITGAASVDGNVNDNSTSWEDHSDYFSYLFQMTKAEMKAGADHLYTDPPNDVTPVDGVTWVDLTGINLFNATSSGWSGSGILVVEGGKGIKITGGGFDGIIYCIGEFSIPAGNPEINGTILVENDVTDTTKIRGNADVNYDIDAIEDALDELSPGQMVSWWEPLP